MPTFIRLTGCTSAEEKNLGLNNKKLYYIISQDRFLRIPGCPIAYWVNSKITDIFESKDKASSICKTRTGLATGNNSLYTRCYWEVGRSSIGRGLTRDQALLSQKKWFPYSNGGTSRKWYGNNEDIVNWENDGNELQTRQHESGRIRAHNFNLDVIFKPAATWSLIGMTSTMVRYTEKGALFSSGAPSLFAQPNDLEYMLGILNTKICTYFQELLNPTINANSGDVLNYPIIKVEMSELVAKAISIAKLDWDLRENSMDFKRSPLMTDYRESCRKNIIDSILVGWDWPSKYNIENNLSFLSQYNIFRDYWSSLFLELHKTEQEINRITIDAYCLTDELQATLPFTEITILQEELVESSRKENRVEFNDSIIAQQFVSYGVGCLMGRYSVEIDGLVLADLNATIDDFKTIIPNARFLPDEDGILPLTDEDDFSDDLPTAFKSWLRFISGEHYDDNLRWIEDRLGKDLRSFFDRDFYKDHIKRYKSRPIYWMVSSPSGAYRALIYLHRYTKDTVGKILNDYVRPYRTKIEQKIRGLESIMDSAGSSAGDKTKAKKRLAQLEKYKIEIEAWEKDSLYPMALKRIELDLDDGVKVNYRKLQGILEPVKQLEAKEED